MKTPSQEEIEYQSTILCKVRMIDAVDGMTKESMYKAGFDDGIEFLKSQPKDINVPQSGDVRTLNQCRAAINKNYKVGDLEHTEEERETKAVKLYESQFDVKKLQAELEHVKADNVKLKELISSMCSLWRKSHGSSSMHSIILEAEKALQSTKQ